MLLVLNVLKSYWFGIVLFTCLLPISLYCPWQQLMILTGSWSWIDLNPLGTYLKLEGEACFWGTWLSWPLKKGPKQVHDVPVLRQSGLLFYHIELEVQVVICHKKCSFFKHIYNKSYYLFSGTFSSEFNVSFNVCNANCSREPLESSIAYQRVQH